ncbi:MbnP family protein, partial [Nostoc sp. NIES-2111]
SWVWNAGRKFARLDFSSTGAPRGYAIHLGSTGCTPSENKNAAPTSCSAPNLATVDLRNFQPGKDVVLADLGALLADSNVDAAGKMMSGCMSGPQTPACAPLFLHLGLAFPGQTPKPQDFFRSSSTLVTQAAR